jgi:hypothetical protein
MKIALLATMLAFGGSLAGFGITAATGGPDAPVAASSPTVSTEDVVVRGNGPDCPKAVAEKA